ncbi:putative peptidoglycan D,D-transpeptidase FtsI [bacterium HR40]|nr:putative peptidoglycan D,D-transpeptidase FtsI [bacterium HR40]
MSASAGGPGSTGLAAARLRLRVVAVALAVAFTSMGVRLIDLGERASERDQPRPAATVDGEEQPARADIVDRRGRLLATDVTTYALAADPANVGDPALAAQALARVLGEVDAAELERRFLAGRRFAWVDRELSAEQLRGVMELGLKGLHFLPRRKRIWPQGELAGHVVGFTGVDQQGLSGIELALDRRLREDPEPLVLSLDLRVQQIVHEEVGEAVKRFRARAACGLVQDVESGELLALVSLPEFDPNRWQRTGPSERRNSCTGNIYELGSLFKVITAAMALDSGKVGLSDRFDATEPLRIGRHRIRDDHAKRRPLSVPEIIAYSSNIGTARMAFAAGGGEAEQAFLRKLGFDRPLAVELPDRTPPLLPSRWPEIVAATVSFGHGIAVSPLQFANATASLVGSGRLLRPTLLRLAGAPEPGPQLISQRTVTDLRWLLWLTVEKGTGTRARLSRYALGGKTGTADKPASQRRGYRSGEVVASFVGIFPIDQPRYLVLVSLDEPKGDASTYGFRYGGWTAAPVVARIVDRSGPLLGVPPTEGETLQALRERLLVSETPHALTGHPEERLAALDAGR